VSSFAGFVPAEAPRLTAMVVLDRPTPIFGGTVAAPVFADLARYSLREMKVPPPGVPLPATRARAADTDAARSVGDAGAGGSSAAASLPPTSAASTATSATAPAPATTPTSGAKASPQSSTTTTVGGAGPPATRRRAATVGPRPTTATTRR
jgi:hypothetical protein